MDDLKLWLERVLNYKAHLKSNPVSISQLVWNLDWISAIPCAKWKVKNCKHMQLFDATENWEQEFPGTYKVKNCNSFSREAPNTPVRHHEVLQRTWHSLKIQFALKTCVERAAHGELWALGVWLVLGSWISEQHCTRLSGFCLFLRGSDSSQ